MQSPRAPSTIDNRPAIPDPFALSPGDIAPPCVLPALDGRIVDIHNDAIAGNPIVLLFCHQFSAAVTDAIGRMAAAQAPLVATGARPFVIARERPEIAQARPIRFPVLLDSDGEAFCRFNAHSSHGLTTVVLRPNQHVMAILDGPPPDQVTEALAQLARLRDAHQAALMSHHPPVLMVPDVLSPADCRNLIGVYETRGRRFMPPGPGIDYIGTDYKMRIPEYGRADRIDHWIVDGDTTVLLHRRLEQRLLPEIVKAFQYRVTRWERLRIGCYQGERGGELHGHRDDAEPTPYRRFAMSINLNVDAFAGGELRFPEFGDQRYRPANGTAIVFSSSLLHEALHVTSGRRLVLLAFLFGDH